MEYIIFFWKMRGQFKLLESNRIGLTPLWYCSKTMRMAIIFSTFHFEGQATLYDQMYNYIRKSKLKITYQDIFLDTNIILHFIDTVPISLK